MKKNLFFAFLLLSCTAMGQGKFFGGSGDGFATATITNNVLPVQVLQFSASLAGSTVNASLRLSHLQSVCSVQLEKSVDGFAFVPVAPVQYVTASSSPLFLFRYPHISNGTVYFRAAIRACNGSLSHTAIIPVRAGGAARVFVTGGALYYQQVPPASFIRLFNTAGQEVFTKRLDGGSGVLPLSGALLPGVYWLHLNGSTAISVIVE